MPKLNLKDACAQGWQRFRQAPMGDKLTTAFNLCAVPLYLAGEGLQKLAGTSMDVYNALPEGLGNFMQGHFSGFWGACALSYVLLRNARDMLPRVPLKEEFSTVASLAALTYWEVQKLSGSDGAGNLSFDWPDMFVYGASLALFYGLNKTYQDVSMRQSSQAASAPKADMPTLK